MHRNTSPFSLSLYLYINSISLFEISIRFGYLYMIPLYIDVFDKEKWMEAGMYKIEDVPCFVGTDEEKQGDSVFVILPSDHMLEAEAFGAEVKYGKKPEETRTGSYVCERLEEVLSLPEMDFERGRMREIMERCSQIENGQENKRVLLELSGPFTILNGLMDIKIAYKAMRKQPELMEAVLERLKKEQLRFLMRAKEAGVRFFSYGDAPGSLTMLGQSGLEMVTHKFTIDFLKKAEHEIRDDGLMILCPKVSAALKGLKVVETISWSLPEEMTYEKICRSLAGKGYLSGQICLNALQVLIKNGKIEVLKL